MRSFLSCWFLTRTSKSTFPRFACYWQTLGFLYLENTVWVNLRYYSGARSKFECALECHTFSPFSRADLYVDHFPLSSKGYPHSWRHLGFWEILLWTFLPFPFLHGLAIESKPRVIEILTNEVFNSKNLFGLPFLVFHFCSESVWEQFVFVLLDWNGRICSMCSCTSKFLIGSNGQ